LRPGLTEFLIRLTADRLAGVARAGPYRKPSGRRRHGGSKVAWPGSGYALLFSSPGPLVTAAAVYKNLDYDPIKSFAPIAMLIYAPQMLVAHPSIPAHSLNEFIVYANSNPGKIPARNRCATEMVPPAASE
jgi:tripartite-type tricarboxylate transporter receptor subunit TctC